MNQKELNSFRRRVWKKYHIPNSGNLNSVKQDAIFIHVPKGNHEIGYPHEKKKFDICFVLKKAKMKFITEAQSCKDKRIVDIVVLDTGTEIEIVDTSLTKKSKEAIERGDVPILVKGICDDFSIDELIRRNI